MIFDRDKIQSINHLYNQSPPSLPYIFNKPQNQQSNKSLYKNDSQSSHLTINPQTYQLNQNQTLKNSLNNKFSFASNNQIHNSISIKRYLKKGQDFNKFHLNKISKIDTNFLNLQDNPNKNIKLPKEYSINRFLVESNQDNSYQKHLQKIYLSTTNKNNRSNNTKLSKYPQKKNKRFSTLSKISKPKQEKKVVNQEVQTQKRTTEKNIIKPKKVIKNLQNIQKSNRKIPKINTLQLLQKQQYQKKALNQKGNTVSTSKFINLSSILQKDQQQPQPPKKLSSIRHNHLQTKYLINQSFSGQQSTAPSMYTNTYLDSMSKLSSNFNSQIDKIRKNIRYDFSQRSQKLSPEKYSRTIDLTDNVSRNFQLLQNNPITKNLNIQSKNQQSLINVSKSSQNSRNKNLNNKIQKFQSQQNNNKIINKNNQQLQEENKGMSLSVVPEQSQTMNQYDERSRYEPFSALSIVNQQKQDIVREQNRNQKLHKQISLQDNIKQKTLNDKKVFKNKKTVDQIMQFPQISQLKISPMQNQNTQQKYIHPIRNNFNQKGINWITDSYHPKSKILDFINTKNFIIKKYRNGVYFGQLQDSKKHGHGIIFYFNGKLYEGKFQNDLKNGQGYQQFPDGSKYQGHFKNGAKSGKGIFQWSNGQVYQGQWLNGKKHGSGIWKSYQGESYIGQWKNGKAEGFGVYISKLGDRYQGQFQNSQKNGYGTQRYHNGQTYVGQYRKNRPNGQGEYFWSNGNYYKGEFVNHLRHGEGYFKDIKNNIEYKGQYRNDKRCGFGQLKQENGTYVGNFENDYKHGYGQFYQMNECKYKGYWINGKTLDEDEQHDQNCQLKKNNIEIISQKPQLANYKSNAKINRLRTVNNINNKNINNINNRNVNISSKNQQNKNSLGKSKSPQNKSIQSLQNNSLEKSNYKRSCGCARRH